VPAINFGLSGKVQQSVIRNCLSRLETGTNGAGRLLPTRWLYVSPAPFRQLSRQLNYKSLSRD